MTGFVVAKQIPDTFEDNQKQPAGYDTPSDQIPAEGMPLAEKTRNLLTFLSQRVPMGKEG
jgi:hypothetical protein